MVPPDILVHYLKGTITPSYRSIRHAVKPCFRNRSWGKELSRTSRQNATVPRVLILPPWLLQGAPRGRLNDEGGAAGVALRSSLLRDPGSSQGNYAVNGGIVRPPIRACLVG
jgi:hypothetical protein